MTSIHITPYQNYAIIIIQVTERYTSLTVYIKISDTEAIRNFGTEHPRQLTIEGDNFPGLYLKIQFAPHSKDTTASVKKKSVIDAQENNSCLFWDAHNTQMHCAGKNSQGYLIGGKGSWCVRLTTLTPSFADCLEILKTQPPGALRARPSH